MRVALHLFKFEHFSLAKQVGFWLRAFEQIYEFIILCAGRCLVPHVFLNEILEVGYVLVDRFIRVDAGVP